MVRVSFLIFFNPTYCPDFLLHIMDSRYTLKASLGFLKGIAAAYLCIGAEGLTKKVYRGRVLTWIHVQQGDTDNVLTHWTVGPEDSTMRHNQTLDCSIIPGNTWMVSLWSNLLWTSPCNLSRWVLWTFLNWVHSLVLVIKYIYLNCVEPWVNLSKIKVWEGAKTSPERKNNFGFQFGRLGWSVTYHYPFLMQVLGRWLCWKISSIF